jgi:Raf kinase inhibitor-like YbhB/YbcL family protein
MTIAVPNPVDQLPDVPAFTLTSSDLVDGGTLKVDQVYSGMGLEGGNRSPALSWTAFPEGTQSFTVACFDPDAPTMSGFWHWVVIDLPAKTTDLPAGAGTEHGLPGGIHLRNDYGTRDFGGAAPPPGNAPHRYYFVVNALSVPTLEVGPDATPAYAMFAAGLHTIGRAVLTGRYSRD